MDKHTLEDIGQHVPYFFLVLFKLKKGRKRHYQLFFPTLDTRKDNRIKKILGWFLGTEVSIIVSGIEITDR